MKRKQDSLELDDEMLNLISHYAQITPVNKTMLKSMSLLDKQALFYSAEDEGQIDTLQHLIEDEQLHTIREHLEKVNLRKGFNCLFYGTPDLNHIKELCSKEHIAKSNTNSRRPIGFLN